MRPHRVVAGAALIAVLASVAVAGTVGSRSPSPAASIDPNAFTAIRLGAGSAAGRMTTYSPDPANDAAAGLEAGLVLREPATPLARGLPPLNIPLAQPKALAVSRVVRTAFGTVSGGWHHNPDESWYGPGFYGQRTACGETLTTTLMGVANKTLPCGTLVELRNPRNGATITVRVVDRGPYVAGREWDLTYATCSAIDHCWTGALDWRFP